MTNAFAASQPAFILPYQGTSPHFATPPIFTGAGSSVLGRVTIGARSCIGAGVVVRADGHVVEAGDDFWLGDLATVHIAHDIYPAIIGHRVTVGRNAVVHACTVGNDCVIEDNVVILDGAIVEDGVLIEAGSTVFPRSTLKAGMIYAGSPAKPLGDLSRTELERRQAQLKERIAAASHAPHPPPSAPSAHAPFVAATARVRGRLEMGPRSSVFFGCDLDAGEATIRIGENTNVQDNTVVRCGTGGMTIGRDSTIGHNVNMGDCRIGDRCLIGIGSTVAADTVIEDDVLLAAGAVTNAGQRLEAGWVWGGRPARPLSKLDDGKKAMMSLIVEQYCDYADAYRAAQEAQR